MKNFDISQFNTKENPLKNLVIEASAGCGKTHNVCEIVSKFVLDGENLSKILVVTYTEKATGELKERIRNKLSKDKSINFNQNDLNIYTIHSFCQNTIKEFGVLANQPLNLSVVNEKLELKDYINRYLRSGNILSDIEKTIDIITIDSLIDAFIKVLSSYSLTYDYKIDQNIIDIKDRSEYLDLYNTYIKSSNPFNEVYSRDLTFRSYYDTLNSSDIYKVKLFAMDIKNNFGIHNELFSGTEYRKPSTNKKNPYGWLENVTNYEAFMYFYEFKETLKKLSKPSNVYNLFIVKYIDDLYKKWQIEKINNKKQTFNDMLRVVREEVTKKATKGKLTLKDKLKEKYKIAIIDEFQDTNYLQYDIFKNIFLEDSSHHLIVVGDPKQSIYAFQGADFSVYNRAKGEIANWGEINTLLTNYRSSREMVASCNKFFKGVFNGFVDSKANSIKELKLYYKNKEARPIAIINNDNGISDTDYAKEVVKRIVDYCSLDESGKTNLIKYINDKKENKETLENVKFSDFAILARKRSEFAPIERELKKCGIPFIKYKDEGLFLGKECADFIAILEAVNVKDFIGRGRKIFRKALFTNFFNRTIEEISSSYYDFDDSREMELVNKWRILAKERNWEELIDNIILDSYVLERLSNLSQYQSVAKYKQLGDYCIDYLYNNHTLDDLIRNLNNQKTKVEGDDSKVIMATDFDCVKLMTFHASKGLQFPIVINVGGYGSPMGSNMCHNSLGLREITFNPDDAKRDLVEEWNRLVYVAYTRAEFLLVIPNPKEVKSDNYQLNNLIDFTQTFMDDYKDYYELVEFRGSINYKSLIDGVKKILKVGQNTSSSSKDKQDATLKELIKEKKNKISYKHSYSSLSHETIQDTDEDEVENKEGEESIGLSIFDRNIKKVVPNYDNTLLPTTEPAGFPKGSGIGTALHEVFELIDFTNYESYVDSVIKKALEKQGIEIKDNKVSYIKELVFNVLNAKLPVINGSNALNDSFKLAEINLNDRLSEVEFNFNLLGERYKNYCNGFVDLLFRRGEVYSILDWKSDSLNEDFTSYSNYEALKDHTDDSYSIQRVLYSYCLIEWLSKYYTKLSKEEIFNRHYGGIYYVYLRGCNGETSNGIYCQTWNSYKDLVDAFNNIVKKKVGVR